ncbi:MAG: LutC/YkgG family protein [Gammaproteobacteria bacterium]
MSSAKDEILDGIRLALNRSGPLDAAAAAKLDARLASPPRHLRPALGRETEALFIEKLTKVNGTVERVDSPDAISQAVGRHLARHELGEDLVVAPDPDLAPVRWSNRYRIERRAAIGTDRISVTSAFAGIAESGSCMLLSGVASPTTLNFLPDDHIVVLNANRIVMHMEDAWSMLRTSRPDSASAAGFNMPRTVNLISGPSKTADVELTMQEGAHGPRRLHVILIDA